MNKKFMLLGIALLSMFALQADENETATTETTTQDPTIAAETVKKDDKDCGCKH